ncbi:MAG: protein phosphatase 2C domain-containing protein [Gammaproteobacteria bacterium]|nr:protein phosphatase 2C domain-containing protein [Gammaproteobacteria bacterium]MDX2461782.1 protein phosphatase 2C domain-containing protein [Gammaproteobacteria bacterium]
MNTRSGPGKAHLFFKQDLLEGSLLPLAGGIAALYTKRSPEKETPNEDAIAIIPTGPESGVLAVADGLGGAPAGQQASSLAIQCLVRTVEEAAREDSAIRSGILNGFESANEEVLALAVGAATTLTVVEFDGRLVRHYHVGDSFCLLTGQRGKIKMQSIPHSPVGYAVESGLLDETDAMHHEERHVISNVIGSTDMRIEVGSAVEVAPRDTLLLASDGLSDNLHMPEIVECIRKGSLDSVTQALSRLARERMEGSDKDEPSKPDDVTFAVFRLVMK